MDSGSSHDLPHHFLHKGQQFSRFSTEFRPENWAEIEEAK
jgi:hypothetical protein